MFEKWRIERIYGGSAIVFHVIEFLSKSVINFRFLNFTLNLNISLNEFLVSLFWLKKQNLVFYFQS